MRLRRSPERFAQQLRASPGIRRTQRNDRSHDNKKPGLSTGLLIVAYRDAAYAASSATAASSPSTSASAIAFAVGLDFGLGLGAAARALGELAFDFLDRLGFRHVLHDGDFARQAIERRFIELAFAVGLLGLRFRAIEIAHHFGDRDDVARN